MNIRTLRNIVGMTQCQFAEHLGLSQATVSKWERNGPPEYAEKAVELALGSALDVCLTPLQLAGALHIDLKGLEDLLASGYGPKFFRLPNGEIRIRRSDYEDWLRAKIDSGTRRAG